jgi:hypothetical protein
MRPEDISYQLLRLDPENPRVPEGTGRRQSELLQFIYDRGSLAELADSFLDNGYFAPERLVVRTDDDKYVVVEGNRRLATLMILHGVPEADGMRLTDEDPTDEQLERLEVIPCLVIEDGDLVEQYLAFRHIGGLKTWGPEAKARYIARMVSEAVERGESDVFRSVGRRVGSNAQGVRNPYLALSVLRYARDELSIPTEYVQYERFGVWVRCMNSVDIRGYMGLGDPRSYEEIESSLRGIQTEALSEIISDLTPRGIRKPVLQDSRDVTDYGRVLANPTARQVLRTHDDLEVAKQVIRQQSLADRIARVATNVDLLIAEINQLDNLAEEDSGHDLEREADHLAGAARTLRAGIRGLLGEP